MTNLNRTPNSETDTTWIFEPGHTEAAFRARHMMVTWVRGLFKDVHGQAHIDFDDPMASTFFGQIDATRIWTGEPARDAHLRSPDFFDVENHPLITFEGRCTERIGHSHFKASADLTIRGITRPVALAVDYLGPWESPFWAGDENKGIMRPWGAFIRPLRREGDRGEQADSWLDRAYSAVPAAAPLGRRHPAA